MGMQSSVMEQLVGEIEATPDEYRPILLEIVRLFRHNVTRKSAEASFEQGWREALAGQTRPVSELWNGIDHD